MNNPSNTSGDQKTGRLQWQVLGPVFYPASAIILGLTLLALLFSTVLGEFFETIQTGIANYSGWFYVLTMNLLVGLVIYIAGSRFGNIRLGGEDAEPEFSYLGWFAMLFSAGMGIGLLFYSVAEPMFHYAVSSPRAEPGSVEAAQEGMGFAFLHWGLHPWGIYAMVGLALAFFSYNRGAPLTIRAVFYPLLKDRIYGPAGHVIDILATVATLFGVATSLGLGVQQIYAGLNHLLGLSATSGGDGQGTGVVALTTQLILIAAITGMATLSVVKGLDAGIRRISELNLFFAFALLVFVLALGPTLFIFNALVENIGYYLQNLPRLATWNETYQNTDWQNGWTVFYWGWWIAWSPFVGMFIARVSRGRTVREFILSVLLIPSAVTFLWITVFGDTALNIEMYGEGGIANAVQDNIPVALFVLLDYFPLSTLTSVLAVVVVVFFFVTSSDSGSMVIDIITAGGNPEPPVAQRVFWAITEGVVAGLLLLGGGLVALQSAAIATGMPFSVVLLIMGISLVRGFQEYAPPPPLATMEADAKAAAYFGGNRGSGGETGSQPGTERSTGSPGVNKRWIQVAATGAIVVAAVIASLLAGRERAIAPGASTLHPDVVVRVAYVDWSNDIASAHLIKAVLQTRLGYRCVLSEFDGPRAMYQAVASGEQDALLSAWLPDLHAEYYREVKDDLIDLGPNLEGTRVGLVVPTVSTGRQTGERGLRVPSAQRAVRTIGDLRDYAGRFGGQIFGIEPKAGIMRRTRKAMEVYDLERSYTLVEGSEQSMTATLSEAIQNEEGVVVTGWQPHWMFSRWRLHMLEDPKGIYHRTGLAEAQKETENDAAPREGAIHTLVRQGLEADLPAVYRFLDRFHWTPTQMSRLMEWTERPKGRPYASALRWIRTHPAQVQAWIGPLETSDKAQTK